MPTTVEVLIKKKISNIITSCHIPVNEEVHYRIYNHTGQLVFSKSIILVNAEAKMMEELDVSTLPKGDYQLGISTAGNRLLKKINIII